MDPSTPPVELGLGSCASSRAPVLVIAPSSSPRYSPDRCGLVLLVALCHRRRGEHPREWSTTKLLGSSIHADMRWRPWVLGLVVVVLLGYAIYATVRMASLESQLAFDVIAKEQTFLTAGDATHAPSMKGCVRYRALGTTQEKCVMTLVRSTQFPNAPVSSDWSCYSDARIGYPLPRSCGGP